MHIFLKRLFLSVFIPLFLLGLIYFVTDPFKTLKPFSLSYFDSGNRDYLSTELFLHNKRHNYNSFILGSSSACGLNTYHWKSYLSDSAQVFLFQSWSETITGIEQKLAYLDAHGSHIDNCLILIDIPSTFDKNQLPTEAISIKDYHISGMPFWKFELILLYNFIQKPSQWIKSIRLYFNPVCESVAFDTITNDFSIRNKNYSSFMSKPKQDSLKNQSEISKKAFLKSIRNITLDEVIESEPLITSEYEKKLVNIKSILKKQNSQYEIIVVPFICYIHPSINHKDLTILNKIFGHEHVHNYSGRNEITTDYNNFSDINHFGLCAGWTIIEDIYNRN